MANKLTGKIRHIGQTVSFQSKDGSKTYTKRELVIDAATYDRYTGQEEYSSPVLFEFSGDNCALLDNMQPGQHVTVSFTLQGREYKKPDTGETKYFNTVRGYKVEPYGNPARKEAQPQEEAWQPQALPAEPDPQEAESNNDPLPF